MLDLTLVPLNGLHPSPGERADGTRAHWTMEGGDPHFLVALPDLVPAGTYRLEIDLGTPVVDLFGPKLYPDYGEGWSEANALPLHLVPGAGHVYAHITLTKQAQSLRFDPSEADGDLVLGRARMVPVSETALRTQRLVRAARLRLRDWPSARRTGTHALDLWREEGLRGVRGRIGEIVADDTLGIGRLLDGSYARWAEAYDTPSPEDLAEQRRKAGEWRDAPLVSVLMPTYNPPRRMVIEAIESVRAQSYPNWELCIADDASTRSHVRRVLRRYARKDPRIKVMFREANGHICASSNSALELCEGEWVALLDHDDMLAPHALFKIAEATRAFPSALLVYSDEDKIDERGRRTDPYFKPAFNVDLLLGHNFVCHLSAFRRERMVAIGGFREGMEGSQDHDLALRFTDGLDPDEIVHVPHTLYHWRIHADSTASDISTKTYAQSAGTKAIGDHLERTGQAGEVSVVPHGYRVTFARPNVPPLVSLIVPTRDGLETLPQLVGSIERHTEYPRYEFVIVDNGSQLPEMKAYLRDLSRRRNVTVIRDERPFNYSALNNVAVKRAKGDVLVLVNDDIEVHAGDWLDELVSVALRPGVGAVGAKLLYPDGTLQHGGVITGIGGVAGHSHKYAAEGALGTNARLLFRQRLSAVTAACLAVRRSIYEEVGGLEEDGLAVAFNDVDFCLRVDAAGYRNIWTPHVVMTHHESKSRGLEDSPEKLKRFQGEILFIQARWGDRLENDPFYSPCLSRDTEDFRLAYPPFHRAPRIPQHAHASTPLQRTSR